jgi:hypothetical protein
MIQKIEILRSGPHVEKYQFQVTIQVLEIYDEQVRDLFSNANAPGGPKIRMNPTTGVEVVDLIRVAGRKLKGIQGDRRAHRNRQ